MREDVHQPFVDEELERYLDGDLPASRARELEAACDVQPELARAIEQKREVRELLVGHLHRAADQVDWSRFQQEIQVRCQGTESPEPWGTRLEIWLREVLAHRKPFWVPSLAMAAAAAILLVLPDVMGPTEGQALDAPAPLVTVHRRSENSLDVAANAGVEVASLETGTAMAMVYRLPASQTTVIWIGDSTDDESGSK